MQEDPSNGRMTKEHLSNGRIKEEDPRTYRTDRHNEREHSNNISLSREEFARVVTLWNIYASGVNVAPSSVHLSAMLY